MQRDWWAVQQRFVRGLVSRWDGAGYVSRLDMRGSSRGSALRCRELNSGSRYRRSNMKWCMYSIVACCSRTWKASTSPIVITPARPRSVTTGKWRIRFPVIMAAHSSTGVSGAQAVTGVVMTSATLVAAGSRRGATTRRRMSRSVKMPTSRPPWVTTSPPIPRSLMSSAALSTVSPGFTEMTSLPFLVRISWTVGTLPPPAGGFLDTTALTARAPPYRVPAMHIEEGASSGGAAMAQARINVGPLDARARQIAGVLAIVGGLTALDGFFQALGFLTWIVCATMMYVGIILAMGGFKDGTAVFGFPLLILSVLDAWLPLVHKGYWGFIAGVVVAIAAFTTARTRQCPVNALLGVNTAQGSA